VEQRKVLLIIVSVAIVLAATIGVGLWLFYPRDAAEPDSIAEAGGGLEWEPLDYLRGDGEVPGLEEDEPEDDGDFIVTYGVAEDDARPTDSGDRFVTEEPSPEADRPGETASDAPVAGRVSTDADRVSDAGVEARAAGTEATVASPTTATSRDTALPATSPATAGSVAASTRAERPAPPVVVPDAELADRAYWVQAISSPNRDTIEQAGRTLREHQLGTRILTKEIGGTTYFRLRLGPFAVREEAEKFLGWVIEIDGFSDSMIFVDYTTAVATAQSR